MRVVKLGNGRQVGLGEYVAVWKRVASEPADKPYAHGLTGWWSTTAGQVLRDFRRGMHDRINRHLPDYGNSHKWDEDWQRATQQAAHRLNTHRLVVRATEVPVWLRTKVRPGRFWEEEGY